MNKWVYDLGCYLYFEGNTMTTIHAVYWTSNTSATAGLHADAVFWDRSKLEFPNVLMLDRLRKKYCILELYFIFQNYFVSLHAQTWQA